MRIGVIRSRYTPYGGAEVFLARFIAELQKRGHTVDLFAREWDVPSPDSSGMRLHRVRACGPSFLKPLVFALNARRAVRRVRPDVVISLERTLEQDIYRAGDGCHREWLVRRKRAASPLKRVLIGLNPLHPVLLYLERRLFSAPTLKKVAANSEMVHADIQRHYGLPDEKICVIYNGVKIPELAENERVTARADLRRRYRIPDDAVVLLFVGSGFERKGLLYLIRALAALKAKGPVRLRALVVGKGRPDSYLREAESLGVRDMIVFAGPVKGAAEYFAAGDIFVLPTLYEPFSNACLEAMASGLPVVTSRANGISEIITEGVDGAVVEDATDHHAIARGVTLFLDPEKRARAGLSARKTAEKFPIEKNVNEFLELLKEV